jgi:hypothetical protein
MSKGGETGSGQLEISWAAETDRVASGFLYRVDGFSTKE